MGLFPIFKEKKLDENKQLKEINFDPHYEKNYKHSERVYNNIKLFKEHKKESLLVVKNNRQSEKTEKLKNFRKSKEEKIEKTKTSIEKKEENETKDIYINFGKNEEENDREEQFQSIYEEKRKEFEKRNPSPM